MVEEIIKKGNIFIRECKYCKRKFYSVYEKQVNFNKAVHELSCKERGFSEGMKLSLFILFIFTISSASAWPLQLLQNGTIIDLGTNAAINGTSVNFIYFNDTLYLIPATITNITYLNITNATNITYQNVTNITNVTNCTNCSYAYNYTYNGTGNFTYNRTELDTKLGNYILTTTANSQFFFRTEMAPYPLRSELSIYALKTELNSTNVGDDAISKTTFWIIITIIILIVGTAIAVLFTRD